VKIRITADKVSMEGDLNETPTAAKIFGLLPIEASANRWGDEIYFEIPLEEGSRDAKEVVQIGELGYWPPGHAFCIFFGPTPASRGDEIRPASEVNVVGKLCGDPTAFKEVKAGETVKIETA